MPVCFGAAEGTAVRVGVAPPLRLCHSLDCVAEKAKIFSVFKRRHPVAILSLYLVVAVCIVSVFIHVVIHYFHLCFHLVCLKSYFIETTNEKAMLSICTPFCIILPRKQLTARREKGIIKLYLLLYIHATVFVF